MPVSRLAKGVTTQTQQMTYRRDVDETYIVFENASATSIGSIVHRSDTVAGPSYENTYSVIFKSHTADPGSVSTGQVWYRSDSEALRLRDGTATRTLMSLEKDQTVSGTITLSASPRPNATNSVALGTTLLAFSGIYARVLDTDGANDLEIKRNAVSFIKLDGTDVIINQDTAKLRWSDVNFYRAAANQAKTDDDLITGTKFIARTAIGSSVLLFDGTITQTDPTATNSALHVRNALAHTTGASAFGARPATLELWVDGTSSQAITASISGLSNLVLSAEIRGGQAGNISNLSSIYVALDHSGGGTLANYYGVYVSAPAGAGAITSKYAFVSEDNAGNVGIGVTSPSSKLVVNGSIVTGGVTKSNAIGITGTRWLDGFFGNAITSGTSRLVRSTAVCPICKVQAVRSTGGFLALGSTYDYRDAHCPNCSTMLVERIRHRVEAPVPAPKSMKLMEAPLVNQQSGNTRTVAFRFVYNKGRKDEASNLGFLDEFEIEEWIKGDKATRERLLMKIGLQEWEDIVHTRFMEWQVNRERKEFLRMAASFMKKELMN